MINVHLCMGINVLTAYAPAGMAAVATKIPTVLAAYVTLCPLVIKSAVWPTQMGQTQMGHTMADKDIAAIGILIASVPTCMANTLATPSCISAVR